MNKKLKIAILYSNLILIPLNIVSIVLLLPMLLFKDEITRKYVVNVYIGIDQQQNSALGGNPDECISSRAGEHYPKIAKLIDWLFRNPKHCQESIANEKDDAVLE